MSDEADFALSRAASSAGNAVNEQSLRRFGAQRQEEMNYQARQKNLAADLRNGGLDALLVTHLPNVRYLCGFTGTAGVLLVQAGARSHKLTFYTDGRYTQQAREEVHG